ncbi:MAG TPA: flagellar brake domain-containing protein [Negativicutes bacterium]
MDLKDICQVMKKIEFIEVDLAQKVHTYHSRIEDITEHSIIIAEPYSQGFFLPRKYQKQYTARVVTGNCAYLFKTELLRYIRKPIPLWVISLPVDIQRKQLRGFVRFTGNLDVNLEWIDTENETKNKNTLTKDISGNGIGVISDEIIPIGTKIKAAFSIEIKNSNKLEVKAEGEVTRIIPLETADEKYVIGIKFSKIAEITRVAIIKYIFQKQIERRKKESQLFE